MIVNNTGEECPLSSSVNSERDIVMYPGNLWPDRNYVRTFRLYGYVLFDLEDVVDFKRIPDTAQ